MLWRRGGLGPLPIGTPAKVSVWGQRTLAGTDAVPGGCCLPFHPVSRGDGVFLGYCCVPVFGPMPSETSLLYFPLDSRVRNSLEFLVL